MKNRYTKLRPKIIAAFHESFTKGERLTTGKVKKLAMSFDVDDLNWFWENAELAWTIWYRKIVAQYRHWNPKMGFEEVVKFYKTVQPSYNVSSSTKRIFQQYSTSAPIAYLAGLYCGLHQFKGDKLVFEPSAGNGLLTILAPYPNTIVNELDKTRLAHLQYQYFKTITNWDASKKFPNHYQRNFDAVISNPPFGSLPEIDFQFGNHRIYALDHLMIAHALDTMKDGGKAALIIGNWTHFKKDGRIARNRDFFNWLGRHYWIDDMINIHAGKLYNKQGTAFPLRMILIGGRKKEPFGVAPKESEMPEIKGVVDSFEEMYKRVQRAIKRSNEKRETLSHKVQGYIDMIEFELK